MYKLNDVDMFFDMADGQAVVINFTTGAYYGTSALGSEILSRLLRGCKPDEILKTVKALPGCPDNFENMLNTFIDELKRVNILIDGESAPGGDEPISPETVAEGFDIPLNSFEEVRDLLVADPIHDVDEEQGWPVMKEERTDT